MAERLVEGRSYKHVRKESCVWLRSVVMMHGPANLGPLSRLTALLMGTEWIQFYSVQMKFDVVRPQQVSAQHQASRLHKQMTGENSGY